MMKMKVLLALIVALALPSVARAAYGGTISRQAGEYTFEVVANANVATAVTFLSVTRDRLEVDNTITVLGNLPTVSIAIPAKATRIILQVDTQSGSAFVRINGQFLEVGANPEARIVLDIAN
jgi:hypothetical protein